MSENRTNRKRNDKRGSSEPVLANKRVRRIIAVVGAVLAVVLIAVIVFAVNRDDEEDKAGSIPTPTSFEKPPPQDYEKPTDLPEAPGEEKDSGSVTNENGSTSGEPIKKDSDTDKAVVKDAKSALIEWGKQNSTEKPKDRVKRMKKIAAPDSPMPSEAPLFIDSWHADGEDLDHDHGDSSQTSSTVVVSAIGMYESNGSNNITYTADLEVTVHEKFMDEEFDREPYDFQVAITMEKEGDDWKVGMIIPSPY